jgi:hypothetical protein
MTVKAALVERTLVDTWERAVIVDMLVAGQALAVQGHLEEWRALSCLCPGWTGLSR